MADSVNIMSLYSGSGMHDEAVCAALRVLGFEPRVLGYVEREASAAAWLLGRMEAAALESAPVWVGDLCDLADSDLGAMRGSIDLIVASPPCQPYSSAGKRIGNADERSHGDGDGPLPHTLRIIDRVRPAMVQFENVPEWVTGGHFREFGEQLCNLGYDIAPPLFLAASDVGAPHERERVFIQCRLVDAGGRLWKSRPGRVGVRAASEAMGDSNETGRGRAEPERREGERTSPSGTSKNVLFPSRNDRRASRRRLWERQGRAWNLDPNDDGGRVPPNCPGWCEACAAWACSGEQNDCRPAFMQLAVAGGARREGAERGSAPDDARTGARRSIAECGGHVGHAERAEPGAGETREQGGTRLGRCGCTDAGNRFPMFPPGRNEYRRWAALVAGGLDPACMPAVESKLPALADGLAFSNSELLRLGGNGVVPLAAGVAFAILFGGW